MDAFASLVLAIILASSGCLTEQRQSGVSEGSDAGTVAPPEIASFSLRSHDGRAHPPSEAPRRPILLVESTSPVFGDPEPALILAGDPDEALSRDLAGLPLRPATQSRVVAAEVARRGTAIRIEPLRALEPRASYVLAVGGWAATADGTAIATPFLATFRVGEDPAVVGAALTHTWPADGSANVPTRIPTIGVRFDGPITGDDGIRLVEDDGAEVPVRRQEVLCELIGWRDGRCVVLRPDVTLAAETTHHIEIGDRVRDASGAPIGPLRASFRTGASGVPPDPAFAALACALDELSVAIGCVLADDRSITLRMAADAPVRVWLVTGGASDAAVAPRGEAVLRIDGLDAGTVHEVTLRTVDLAGRERVTAMEIATERDLPRVAITEVRADPRGPEPAQEYVEVANLGSDEVDLAGFTLADRPDREGDTIARSIRLAPLARALLVADAFDPAHPDDDPVPAGTPLVRLGASLAGGGLTNAGEPLFLRDPTGRRVSAAPALSAGAPGVCIVRAIADPRRGDATAFAADTLGGCTPGRSDRVP